MNNMVPKFFYFIALSAFLAHNSALAAEDYPSEVFWGDTHLHTNKSVDANGMGNHKLSADDAYLFAKGRKITAHNGKVAQLSRPLDFLVIADHAENIGVMPTLRSNKSVGFQAHFLESWKDAMKQAFSDTGSVLTSDSNEYFREAFDNIRVGGSAGYFWKTWVTEQLKDDVFTHSVWNEVCESADRYNAPGEFTAFIGFEWTPSSRSARSPNFHRNVIFKGDAKKACQVLPFSIIDSEDVEDLWDYLSHYEELTGDEVLAIPHNGNLSSGKMFKLEDYSGKKADQTYVKNRARWEPLYEMSQIKGDSEAHPSLSPDDKYADFETWHRVGFFGSLPNDFLEQKKYEYARPALKLGLAAENEFGINPFKFGMIGSTDSHTSLSTADENNFWGKLSLLEPSKHRLLPSWNYSASGMAAIWAQENTRESLFRGMKRKEVYATSGPRITLRFFGGWSFNSTDLESNSLAKIGYSKGIPMGGDLRYTGSHTSKPSFLINAAKDPLSVNLDRIQMVKGWLAADGELLEKVYDIALSDLDAQGGSASLSAVWEDHDFDREERAFYYIRVLEVPSPRWTSYDVKRFNLKEEDLVNDREFGPEGTNQKIPMVLQERAYSSPIWYTPE